MKALYLLIPGGWLYLASQVGPLTGAILMFLVVVTGAIVYWRFKIRRQLMRAAQRIEPIFVVSRHPTTGEKLFLPEDIDLLCVHAHYREVMLTVTRQKKLLVESGNGFISEDLPDDSQLPIIPIIFRDGIYVNESWGEFNDRVLGVIRETRALWHQKMKQANNRWYMINAHSQKEYEWEV